MSLMIRCNTTLFMRRNSSNVTVGGKRRDGCILSSHKNTKKIYRTHTTKNNNTIHNTITMNDTALIMGNHRHNHHIYKNHITILKRLTASTTKSTTNKQQTLITSRNPLDNNFFLFTTPLYKDYSFAMMCGHISALLVAISYLAQDILQLRTFASGAIICGSIFQYYRPNPLTIPLRWNVVFLMTNISLASLLYMERKKSEEMSQDLEKIYSHGKFCERDFGRVNFLRLFDNDAFRAVVMKVHLPQGYKLTEFGKQNRRLYFITDLEQDDADSDVGGVRVERNGIVLVDKIQNKFIGEMSFLSYLRHYSEMNKEKQEQEEAIESSSTVSDSPSSPQQQTQPLIFLPSSADVIVNNPKGIVVYVWQFDPLRRMLKEDREVSNALLAYLCHDLQQKLCHATDSQLNVISLSRHKSLERKRKERRRKRLKRRNDHLRSFNVVDDIYDVHGDNEYHSQGLSK